MTHSDYNKVLNKQLSTRELQVYMWGNDYVQSPDMKKQMQYSTFRRMFDSDEELFKSDIAKNNNLQERPKLIPYTTEEIEAVYTKCIKIAQSEGFTSIIDSLQNVSYSLCEMI
jgi:hypothetical protein